MVNDRFGFFIQRVTLYTGYKNKFIFSVKKGFFCNQWITEKYNVYSYNLLKNTYIH